MVREDDALGVSLGLDGEVDDSRAGAENPATGVEKLAGGLDAEGAAPEGDEIGDFSEEGFAALVVPRGAGAFAGSPLVGVPEDRAFCVAKAGEVSEGFEGFRFSAGRRWHRPRHRRCSGSGGVVCGGKFPFLAAGSSSRSEGGEEDCGGPPVGRCSD